MNTKLYVGNLAANTTDRDLHGLFSPQGNVAEVNLPVDGTNRCSRRRRANACSTASGSPSASTAPARRMCRPLMAQRPPGRIALPRDGSTTDPGAGIPSPPLIRGTPRP